MYTDGTGLVYSGMGPDFRVLVRQGQKKAAAYALQYGVRFCVCVCVSAPLMLFLADFFWRLCLRRDARGCSLLLVSSLSFFFFISANRLPPLFPPFSPRRSPSPCCS